MAWENQYMQMVKSKPGIILAEEDRGDVSEAARRELRQRMASHAKVFVELGSGSGLHLLTLAEQNRDTLCLGLEIRFKRAFKTGEKAERLGLSNLLIMRSDARQISQLFEEKEVDGFFVNYPDPWDKRRWLKNRLLNPELLLTMRRLLKPDGFLRYKTDHQEYFASTAKLLGDGGWRIEKHTTDEVVAVLGHEIGHDRLGHVRNLLILSTVQSFAIFALFGWAAQSADLSIALGASSTNIVIGLIGFSALFSPVNLILSTLDNTYSRKAEHAADIFSAKIGNRKDIEDALNRLGVDNLSNPAPHPLYVFMYYNHPTIKQRIAHLRAVAE